MLYLVDAGGAFVLTPMEPVVPSLSGKIEEVREETELSIDELLNRLQEEQAALVQERYGPLPEEQTDAGTQEGPASRTATGDGEGEAGRDSQAWPSRADE